MQGYFGDGGPATQASLMLPEAVAFDNGNLYIADDMNNVVRMVDNTGMITTVAGNGFNSGTGSGGYSGDGGPAINAKLNRVRGIAVDGNHNLYISDYQNFVIRKVNTSGIISTFAGNGSSGNWGDGGPASQAMLEFPRGLAFNGAGNLFIVSYPEIRKITMVNSVEEMSAVQKVDLYPDPAVEKTIISAGGAVFNAITVSDLTGRELMSKRIGDQTSYELDVTDFSDGVYFVTVRGESFSQPRKLIVCK